MVLGCGSESTTTEVFLSIDAQGAARDATSVRVEINTLVIEFERETWPSELLVLPGHGSGAGTFSARAWALADGRVLGAASTEPQFRSGSRREAQLVLLPGADVGAIPDVNAEVHGGTVKQPGANESDAASPGERDSGTQGALDGGSSHDGGSVHSEMDAAGPDASPDVPDPPACRLFAATWSCPVLADRFDCLNQLAALVSNSIGDT